MVPHTHALADLPPHYQDLCKAALVAQKHARCYLSKFKVGAAVLSKDGKIYSGSNNESADYTLTHHAEMGAIDSAVYDGVREIAAVAVIAGEGDIPIFPCGLCRQKIREFGKDVLIFALDSTGKIWIAELDYLIPYGFCPQDLGYGKV